MFAKYICYKGLLTKIHKELLKLNKKTNNSIQKWPKTLTNTLPRKMYRWQISVWKDAQHHIIKELQIATMRYHYTPIRMAKIQTLKTPNANKVVEQQELLFIAGGNEKWYSHFGRQFGGFLQNEIYSYHIIQQLCSLVFTQMSRKLMPTQKLAHGCLQSFIHNCQNTSNQVVL